MRLHLRFEDAAARPGRNHKKEPAMVQTSTLEAGASPAVTSHDPLTIRIRELNDAFRTGKGPYARQQGRAFITSGVLALGNEASLAIVRKVAGFDAFTEDNDPHGEHDFGSFDHDGHTIFWKIDYYATDMERGSPDPSDPNQTCRVLTILLASEY